MLAPMLTTDLLLRAYASGVFPMAVGPRNTVRWFSPDPRAVIPLDARFHIPHGLRRTLRRQPFEVVVDRDFAAVIEACATAHGETWISPQIRRAYQALHEEGYAHSVECWQDGQLAGGLYGVHLGGAFFGESMFHRVTDASKVALVGLVERLRAGGFTLLDTQWTTPHLSQFGTMEIPRDTYLQLLEESLRRPCCF
ncbi:MAG: leucyl/phenylalanyl-tRNA--protein transferase [Verrucomicrobiota bacterium]|jgi:leucyl/phenylalanyl-tRNA--protein transferase